VEIDRDLAGVLRERFGAAPRFRLIEGDALEGKHALNADLLTLLRSALETGRRCKLVANLPYNIASPLIVELLLAGVELLTFTVQKEVADRLKAAPGSDAYGGLSIMAQLLANVEVLRTLPPQAFWPAPKIESALVRMSRRDRLGDQARPFGQFVQLLFSARRKTLRKGLSNAGLNAEALLEAAGLSGSRRAEELAPEQFVAIYRAHRSISATSFTRDSSSVL
jgi:16S rRNA (adenine1518-N6/adenine1519-N6)-dimethyltransferase